MNITTPSLSVTGATIRYGAHTVLQDITLPEATAGTVTALIGPNAAGKSTLLRAIAGLQTMQGDVRLGEVILSQRPAIERAQRIVYLPQTLPARSRLSVFEAILSACMAGRSRQHTDTALALVEQMLARLGLSPLASHQLDTLSGGQRQLVGMAQALVRQPQVLLLDEPTSALDLYHQLQVLDIVTRETRAHQLITLIVLHDINLALRHADTVLVLHNGRIAGHGKPEQVITPELLARVYGVDGFVTTIDGIHQVIIRHCLPQEAIPA